MPTPVSIAETWDAGRLTVDGIKVFLRLIVQLLRLLLQFLEPSLRIDIDRIFGVLPDVELGLELLRRAHYALLDSLQTHLCSCAPAVAGTERKRRGQLDNVWDVLRGVGRKATLAASRELRRWGEWWGGEVLLYLIRLLPNGAVFAAFPVIQ